MSTPEAFLLLTLENATLTTPTLGQSGTLGLECVTVQIPDAPTAVDRDVYLILRLGSIETPIDPTRVIHRADGEGWRKYTFHGTEVEKEMDITFLLPADEKSHSPFMEDLDTFESILAQYADLRGSLDSAGQISNPVGDSQATGLEFSGGHGDLRGHLVVINEDTGEVVGQFDDSRFRIQEDPKLHQKGHEGDAVIIEIPDSLNTVEADEGRTPMEMFIRTVPADQQDWITKSATLVSHAISQTTNLLLTTITTASSYYVSHSTPSLASHPSGSGTPNSRGPSAEAPPPLPPRALVFLTSKRTRAGLAGVHAITGQAVKVSSMTVSMIDNTIRRAMGANPKRQRAFLPNASLSPSPSSSPRMLSPPGKQPHFPTRTPSPSPSSTYLAPPPTYYPVSTSSPPFPNDKPTVPPRRSPSPTPPALPRTMIGAPPNVGIHAPHPYHPDSAGPIVGHKPPLPPRSSPSPSPIPFPPRTGSGVPAGVTPLPHPALTTRARVLLSADLILSTLDHSARQLLNGGVESVGNVVGHKYGPDASHNSVLMAETARNVALVYVDMSGIGRRALLRRAGVQFVKGLANGRK